MAIIDSGGVGGNSHFVAIIDTDSRCPMAAYVGNGAVRDAGWRPSGQYPAIVCCGRWPFVLYNQHSEKINYHVNSSSEVPTTTFTYICSVS